jgi:hypothetical protein
VDTNPPVPSPITGDDKTHTDAKTRELAEAYVGGHLAPAESDAFEEHFFACTECWDDVQTLQKFRDGVRHIAVNGTMETASPWKWAFAAAAVALIALASWTMLVQIPRLEAQLAAVRNVPAPVIIAQAQPNLPLLMLEASRADTATALTVPSAAPRFAIWLDAPLSARGPFRLDILSGDSSIESLTALEPNSHGALTAAVPSEKLPPGKYTARLFGANGALAGEYKFEIRR